MTAAESLSIFNLPILNVSMESALDLIDRQLESDSSAAVYFINAHCVNVAFECEQYASSLRQNTLNFADGIGVAIAARASGRRLIDNVNGTDMFPLLCERLASKATRVFLLGGEPGVADELARQLAAKHSAMRIVGTHQGHFSESEAGEVALRIRETNADLVLVAMGVPRQELWIDRFGTASGARVLMAVGGLFNFYSGRIPRAPLWMRRTGLEWLHRLIQEPQRMWRRYLVGNCIFLFRVATGLLTGNLAGKPPQRLPTTRPVVDKAPSPLRIPESRGTGRFVPTPKN